MAKWYEKAGRIGADIGTLGAYELFRGSDSPMNQLASSLSGRPQARAIRDAAATQEAAQREALDFQKLMYEQGREDQAPWLQSGRQNLTTLNQLMNQNYFDPTEDELGALEAMGRGVEGGPFDASKYNVQDFSYADFDPSKVALDPGFDFRQQQGQKAIERSAAARGMARSGGTMKDLMEYGQNLASQEYGNAYNRARDTYSTNYGKARDVYGTGRENQLDRRGFDYGMYGDDYTKRQNKYGRSVNDFGRRFGARADRFNRLSGMAGAGQQTASSLAGLGQNYGQNYSQGLGQIGDIRGGSITGQANARAQGTQNMMDLLKFGLEQGAKAYGATG